MKNSLRRLLFSCALGFPLATQAQSVNATNRGAKKVTPARIATTVAYRPEIFNGKSAVIIRRTKVDGGDFILLSGVSMEPERLASAAVQLTADREIHGDDAEKNQIIAVADEVPFSSADLRVARRLIDKLKNEPKSKITGVGEVRTTLIYLPSRTGRQQLKSRGGMHFSKGGQAPSR